MAGSARQAEEMLRLQSEALSYIPNVPKDLMRDVRHLADTLDVSLNDRFIKKVKSRIISYLPPLRSAVSWKQYMGMLKTKYEDFESQKKEFRNIFKLVAGVDGIYPDVLRPQAIPDIKDTIEKENNRSWGIDPFHHGAEGRLQDKELLQYTGPHTWVSFNKVKVECGGTSSSDPGKRKVIFSLTVLALLEELIDRGATLDSAVKVFTDFFREQAPDVASRINSLQEVDMKTILNTVETCADVPAEIKLIEKALKNIYRDPTDNIKICGDSFNAKQRLLTELRSFRIDKPSEEDIREEESRIAQVTVEMCLELVTEEVKNMMLEIKMRKGVRGTPMSLSDFYYEVTELERKNPQYRLKERRHQRSQHTVLPVQVHHTETQDEEDEDDQDEYDDQYQEDSYYEDEEDYQPEETEYDTGFDEDDEEAEETPDGSSCFFTVPRGGGRGRPNRRGQASRPRGAGQGQRRPRPRGGGQVRQIRGGPRPRGGPRRGFSTNQSSQGRSGPRPSGQSTHCLRCGESSHRHNTCRKFALFHSEKCPLCPTLNPSKQAIFHPRALCPYVKNGESNYRSPRARSPAAWLAHGFDESGKYRVGSSEYIQKPSKN